MATDRSHRYSSHFEGLEHRRLMSTSLSNGVLTVTGSAANDRIEIDQYNAELYVFENGLLSGIYSSSIQRLVIRANGGNDTIKLWPAVTKGAEIYCGEGNDTAIGAAGGDFIYGENGNDFITGNGGNDNLWAGDGYDTVYGGDGNDQMGGSSGNDYLAAGAGNDSVWGEWGNDSIWGESGNDWICGNDGNDSIVGSTGNDTVYAGTGDDRVFGDAGNDSLEGEDGNDVLTGGANNDTMRGGAGNDYFYAKDDYTDLISGGSGLDTALVDKRPWYAPWQTQDNYSGVETAVEP
jgi:Ca2+-binding RTX toxin-like protein